MNRPAVVLAAALALVSGSLAAQQRPESSLPRNTQRLFEAPRDTVVRRKAVRYSDWYGRRLTIHRYGSYTMLPLFVTQYVLGDKLLNQEQAIFDNQRAVPIDSRLRTTHAIVASGVGTLFLINTTTGLWNLFDSRHNTAGRTRRTIHALTMLASDAGFVYTGVLGSHATHGGLQDARKHRDVALTSFGIATVGASFMWFGRGS